MITLSHRAEDTVKWNEQMDRLRETAMTRKKRKKLEVRREEKQMEKATFLRGGLGDRVLENKNI